MAHVLEILIPVTGEINGLERTVASLLAQTDRGFAVLLGDDHANEEQKLIAAGIAVRRVKFEAGTQRAERWNYLCAQAEGAWIKLLLPGDELTPKFVERIKQRISECPSARMIRCDVVVKTDWGVDRIGAPFQQSAVTVEEILNWFPAKVDWLARTTGFVYERTAWLGLGGYATQLPGCAALSLNALLALHFGLENLPEVLANTPAVDSYLNESAGERVNLTLELWLILRQVHNYCLAAKLPWTKRCLLTRAFLAARGRR
jgi:hypothetical protein